MIADGITNLEQSSGSSLNAGNTNQNPQNFDIDYEALSKDVSGDTSQDSGGSDKNETLLTNQNAEIDEKFKDLPIAEAKYRTIQSRYDKLYNLHQQIVEKNTEYEKVVNLFDQMLEDENLLVAFVNQLKPGLVQQKDFKDLIRDRIDKEFGEDFRPTMTRLEAERDDPGGEDWRYYKLLDELEKQYSNNNVTQTKSVQEYLEQKKLLKQKEQEKLKAEYETVKTKMKASDEEIQAAINWGQNMSLEKLLLVHRYLRKVPNKAGVSVETVSGQGSTNSSQREQFLKSIFGNNIKI